MEKTFQSDEPCQLFLLPTLSAIIVGCEREARGYPLYPPE
jgi:hypothetical protein